MPPTSLEDSAILREYAAKTPLSADRYRRARQVFPSGITHDARYLIPHPLFVSHASGPRKWDLDGNEYVDYVGGHGSLILGHGHPAVVEAVARQAARGTHLGASHDLELQWAELVRSMVPSAERVRFTASGTEATHLALRVARAFTGKPAFVRLAGHFHGWHDHVAFGAFAAPAGNPPGILGEIVTRAIVCPPDGMDSLRAAVADRDDVAAVILEPTGASFGHVPLPAGFLAEVRRFTAERGIVLIFDEVITGFRCAPGGAQEFYGVKPDLTALAKILAGGYPGGALTGRADILHVMDYPGLAAPPVPHQGTFNGTPIAATAGCATLNAVRCGPAIENANRAAAALRDEMNAAIRRAGAPWCVYGDFSGFHVYTNPDRAAVSTEDIYAGKLPWSKLKGGMRPELYHKVRAGFLLGGVDVNTWPGGWVSATHGDAEVETTIRAFEKLLAMLAEEGELD